MTNLETILLLKLVFELLPHLTAFKGDIAKETAIVASSEDATQKLIDSIDVAEAMLAEMKSALAGK